MRSSILCGILVVFLIGVNSTRATVVPDKEGGSGKAEIKTYCEPYGSDLFQLPFEGQERACAIVIGDGQTYLGLYVYDPHGNCIAKDDLNHPSARDDLAVEWLPVQTQRYCLEVVNFGQNINQYVLAGK